MPAYDPAKRRRTRQEAGYRGVWVYIPAEELAKLRRPPTRTPSHYRTAGREGGRTVIVTLYDEE